MNRSQVWQNIFHRRSLPWLTPRPTMMSMMTMKQSRNTKERMKSTTVRLRNFLTNEEKSSFFPPKLKCLFLISRRRRRLYSGSRSKHLPDIFRMDFGDRFLTFDLWNIQAPIQVAGAICLCPFWDCFACHLVGDFARVHWQSRCGMVPAVELHDW